MKFKIWFLVFLFTFTLSNMAGKSFLFQQEKDKTIKENNDKRYPKRLKRSESFLGIHFDFHADTDCRNVGAKTTPEMVETILQKVKPDFIQIDCKGHPGLSSYPTKVGNFVQGIVGDPLKIWRDVTAKNGVALYMHYSGVYDRTAVEKDSLWARVNSDGLRDKNMNSVFGPYVDKLLIPQFKELSDVYNVDGVWIDGDCWALANDYSPNVIKQFQERTGISTIPKKKGDPFYFEFCEFNREGYKKYVRHYVNEMHKHNPEFQIASNWAFSSFMPEPVDINVDFISGDFNYLNSVNSARIEGRCIAKQGKPWDLMSWGFVYKGGLNHNYKSSKQLMQEAAVIMAIGGGFQVYYTQNRDGSVPLWKMDIMKDVAKFCRERQKYCQYSKPVPQVGILYSSYNFYLRINSLYGGWNESPSLKGMLFSVLDNQYSTEIVSEHHLTGRMNKYPLIIIPETEALYPDFKDELLEYVKNGGNLIVVGQNTPKLFKNELGYEYNNDTSKIELFWIEQDGLLSCVNTPYRPVSILSDSRQLGKIFKTQDNQVKPETASTIKNYGKGKIGAIYFDLGIQYFKGSSYLLRNYINSMIKEMFPEPMVEIKGSHSVDVSINQVNEKLTINLVNTAGFHNSNTVDIFDEIPSVGPLDISIRCSSKPNKIMLQPEGKSLNYTYVNGKAEIKIPKVEIHSIIIVE